MITWIIGLSGSGKTSIAECLVVKLRETNKSTVLVDGDAVRLIWGDQTSHSISGRRLNAQRISHLCSFLDKQGIDVVAAVLSIFPEWQKWNRINFSNYFEVFLDVSLEVVEKRDTKGLYKLARSGKLENMVGIDIPFIPPPNPDISLDSSGKNGGVVELADIIYNSISKKNCL